MDYSSETNNNNNKLYYQIKVKLMRGALGFSVLRFSLFFRSVFRFLLQKTSVFRFWWSLRFADFSFLVPDVIFGFWKGSEVQ